jgi:hypothetical protein
MGSVIGLPMILIAGLGVFIAYKLDDARIWHLLCATGFGFFLAATAAGPAINHMINAAAHAAH